MSKYIKDEISRQEVNYKIACLIATQSDPETALDLCDLIEKYPQQRFGQIICNYVCTDYRDPEPNLHTKVIMDALFPDVSDPFYEESTVTLKRLLNDFEIEH